MTKYPKPGQYCSVNGVVYRAVKRTNGCQGCNLNNLLTCPGIIDSKTKEKEIDCTTQNIVLKLLA